MQGVLLNLANILLLDYCEREGVDPSDSHVIKNGRGFVYSLVNNSDNKVFTTVTFTKNTAPEYWWGMAAYQRGKIDDRKRYECPHLGCDNVNGKTRAELKAHLSYWHRATFTEIEEVLAKQ